MDCCTDAAEKGTVTTAQASKHSTRQIDTHVETHTGTGKTHSGVDVSSDRDRDRQTEEAWIDTATQRAADIPDKEANTEAG